MAANTSRYFHFTSGKFAWLGLVFLVGFATYALLSFSPSQFTFCLVAILLTWLPGMLLCRYISEWHRLNAWLRHGIAITLGVGLLGTVSLILKVLLLPMQYAGWLVLAFVAFVIIVKRLPATPSPAVSSEKLSWTFVTVVIFLTAALVFIRPVFYTNPVDPNLAQDDWMFAAFIRWSVTEPSRLFPDREVVPSIGITERIVFNGWVQAEAALVSITQYDPASVSFAGIQPLVVLLSLWSIYVLAQSLFQNRNYALLSVVFTALYHFGRLSLYSNYLLWQHDKYIAVFALLGFVVAFGISYLRKPSVGLFLLLIFIFWSITIVHVFGLAAALLCLSCAWLALHGRLVLRRVNWQTGLLLLSASLPGIGYVLLLRQTLSDYIFTLEGDLPGVSLRHFTQTSWGWSLSTQLFADGPNQIGIACALLCILSLRRSFAARYTFILTVSILFLVASPLVSIVVNFVSVVQIVRLTWLVPAGLAVACMIEFLSWLFRNFFYARQAEHAVVILLVIAGGILSYNGVIQSVNHWAGATTHRLNEADRWLAETLRDLPQPTPLVLTTNNRTRMIAFGMTNVRVLSFYYGFYGDQMKSTLDSFNQDNILTDSDLSLLYGMTMDDSTRQLYPKLSLPDYIPYTVDYLVLEENDPVLPAVQELHDLFQLYAAQSPYYVFSVVSIETHYRDAGFSALESGDVSQALSIFALLNRTQSQTPEVQIGYAASLSLNGQQCLGRVQIAKTISLNGWITETITPINAILSEYNMNVDDLNLNINVPEDSCYEIYTSTRTNAIIDVYPENPDGERGLFIIRGVGDNPHAAIVFIHGGAWKGRLEYPTGLEFLRGLSDAGYTVIIPQYRVLPAQYPTAIEDVACALSYVERNAERLGIDPQRVVLWGQSSGAHVAALTLLTPPDNPDCGAGPIYSPAAAVLVAGIYDLPTLEAFSTTTGRPELAENLHLWMGGTPDELTDLYAAASPINAVKSIQTPTLLIFGDADKVVPAEQSERFFNAMFAIGNPIDELIVNGTDHDIQAYFWNEEAIYRNTLPEQIMRQQNVLDFLATALSR